MVELVRETRGDVVENVRMGWIAVVDEGGMVVASAGDPQHLTYYRSASKPIQALPVIARGLDRAYGLTAQETAIFAGSHAGECVHVRVLESIWQKADLREADMVMLPTWPESAAARTEQVSAGGGPRKAFHNCSGKHTALMLLQRVLTGSVQGYHLPDSPAQREVLAAISVLSGVPAEDIRLGIDGCGVPVFAVPLHAIALSFLRLACPETIEDTALRAAAQAFVPRLHAYPEMVKGAGTPCTALNAAAGVVAKGGASGVYALGLQRQRLGIALKLADGANQVRPLIVREVLRQLDCLTPEISAALNPFCGEEIVNDNDQAVGRAVPAFKLDVRV